MSPSTGISENGWQRISTGVMPLLARIAISLIFIQAVLGKIFGWSGQAAYMSAHGMPAVQPLLAAALVIELVGVICLLVGYQASLAAFVMSLYLIIVSVMLHNFWSHPVGRSEMAQMMAQTEFMKNMGIVGGLLMIAAYGPGRFSLQRLLHRGTKYASC